MTANTLTQTTLILAASLAAMTSSSSASELFQGLEGDWRGKGQIQTLGEDNKTHSFTCNMNSHFNSRNQTVTLKGRCGVGLFSKGFKNVYTISPDGTVSGYPILQKGDVAEIKISGKPQPQSLHLKGDNSKNALASTFTLQSENRFLIDSERTKWGNPKEFIKIEWKRK